MCGKLDLYIYKVKCSIYFKAVIFFHGLGFFLFVEYYSVFVEPWINRILIKLFDFLKSFVWRAVLTKCETELFCKRNCDSVHIFRRI